MATIRQNSAPSLPPALARSRPAPSLRALTGRLGFPWRAPDWPGGVERQVRHHQGVQYETAWARRYGVRLARAMLLDDLARPALAVLARPTVTGADRLAGLSAPVIFAANHNSHVDTALVLVSLPVHLRHRTVVAAAADYFFDRPWKAALSAAAIGAIPVDRQRVNRRFTDQAAELLGQGWNLVIFPEGGRSPDGWARPFRGWAAYLSTRTASPVVPIHLEGTGEIHGKRRPGLRRGAARVTIGAPLRPGPGEDARRLAARIEAAVAALADETATDWWQARRRAAAGASPPLTGPPVSSWRRSWALPSASGAGPTPTDGAAGGRRTGADRWAVR